MKKAFITGVTGQDGSYLAKLLLDKGYEVYGGIRRSSINNVWRLKYLDIEDQVNLVQFDLADFSNIFSVIRDTKPDEFYNIGAMSHVGTSFKQPIYTAEINGMAVLNMLTSIRQLCPECKFYQASTSEMFGKTKDKSQDEETPFHPRSPYGISKLFAYWWTVNFREGYGMFCINGILFNHESVLRGENFVTKKIVKYFSKLNKDGYDQPLRLGNLEAKRDWGYSPEYVEGMWKLMQLEEPDDSVLSTGEAISVRDFLLTVAEYYDIQLRSEGKGKEEKFYNSKTKELLVKIDPKFYRPAEVDYLCGDSSKAQKAIDWNPEYTGKKLVEKMCEDEDKLQKS
ncbi:NAD-dependent epimerase/dehydratase family protein [Candidatus Dojkabacteria bacterium]|nr:NAD-dependent epimerase/dehydratase family protein [Candidatus Dojkabacteria bacterium]